MMFRVKKLLRIVQIVLLVGITTAFSAERAFSQELTLASYNIRYANQGDSLKGDGWDRRGPVVAQLIQFHDFDIVGIQEGIYRQLVDLKEAMPNYDYIGIGRDDGKTAGEFSAIFYKTDKFKLLDKGDFWLSTETDHPNKGWDAALPRICSWGQFQDIKTGNTFFFFNAHFDHVGVEARKESAKLILEKIKSIAGNHQTVLAGDFNVDQNNESYQLLNNSDILTDAYEKAPIKYALNGTFNSFNPNSKTESRIDHIFVTDGFKVSRYGVLTDTYRSPVANDDAAVAANSPRGRAAQFEARLPSDHFPVMIKVELNPSK